MRNRKKSVLRFISKLQEMSNDDLAWTTYGDIKVECGFKSEAQVHNLIIEMTGEGFVDRGQEIMGPIKKLRFTEKGREYISWIHPFIMFISNKIFLPIAVTIATVAALALFKNIFISWLKK